MNMKQRRRSTATTGPVPLQRRLAVRRPEPEGACAIRVSHRAERKRSTGSISPRYLLRCGCCEGKVEIYYDDDELEINGVIGSLENWREIHFFRSRDRTRRDESASGIGVPISSSADAGQM
jgi:hypothetical protein